MIPRCADCGGEQRTFTRPHVEVSTGPVRAAVDPRTVIVCDRGCADDEGRLGAALDRALAAGLSFGRVRPGGNAPRCAACDEPLDLPMRATVRSVTVEPQADAPFTLTFALPLVRCGECGTDNVPPGLVDVVHATARETCGVRPAPRPLGLVRWLRRRGVRGSPGHP